MKHILFISDNFYPESGAPANRLYDHATVWVKSGYQVTVLTCVPNFPKGKVFEGYQNKWRQSELINGVKVIRIKSFIAQNKGSLKRIIDYMSFGFHAAIQGLFVKKPDIVIGTSPQPFTIFAAWFVARLKRKAFIFELRDLWPESIVAVDAMAKGNLLLRLLDRAIKRMYQSAELIVAVTDSFKKILVEKEKIEAQKILVCKNGINPDVMVPAASAEVMRKRCQLENQYLVGYVGTIGMAHSVETILNAARTSTDPAVHFIIMGEGAYAGEIRQKAKLCPNVTFIEGGTRQAALNVTNMLDASIVHLKDTPLFRTVIPSKIFEVMALGKPILMGVKGEAEKIVMNEANAGVSFQPEDAKSLNDAIQIIKGSVFDKEKMADFVKTKFNRRKIALEMLDGIKLKLNGKK